MGGWGPRGVVQQRLGVEEGVPMRSRSDLMGHEKNSPLPWQVEGRSRRRLFCFINFGDKELAFFPLIPARDLLDPFGERPESKRPGRFSFLRLEESASSA